MSGCYQIVNALARGVQSGQRPARRRVIKTTICQARIGSETPPRHYIAEWQQLKSLTQQQLADELGTSKATISRWESHARDINGSALRAVASALGLGSTADILYIARSECGKPGCDGRGQARSGQASGGSVDFRHCGCVRRLSVAILST